MINYKSMVKKKIRQEKVFKYMALFEPQKEGGFTVTVPALPGCISEGNTFEEAVRNIKEAALLYLEDINKRNLNITQPLEIFTAPFEVAIGRKWFMKSPTVSGQQVLKALQKNGFVLISQKGSHLKVRRVDSGTGKTTLIIPNHKTLKRGTLSAIIKQPGLKAEKILEFLK